MASSKTSKSVAKSIEKAKALAIKELGMIWRVEYIRRQLSESDFTEYFGMQAGAKLRTVDEHGKIVFKLKSTLRDNSKKKFKEVVTKNKDFIKNFDKSTFQIVRANHHGVNDDDVNNNNDDDDDGNGNDDDDGDDEQDDDDDDDEEEEEDDDEEDDDSVSSTYRSISNDDEFLKDVNSKLRKRRHRAKGVKVRKSTVYSFFLHLLNISLT